MVTFEWFQSFSQKIWLVLWVMVLVGYACLITGCNSSASPRRTTKTITPVSSSASKDRKVSVPECAGDEQTPTLSLGWKLLWQHTFDNPLALPPIIDGSQVALLERADPIPNLYKDTVWMLDAASSKVQWQFDGSVALNLTDHWIDLTSWSPKYFAVVVHDSHAPREFVMVFDRITGQIVRRFDMQALEMAISDNALYFRSGERRLYRFDLPAGVQRWKDERTDYLWQGLYPAGEWLYAFVGVTDPQNGLEILKYRADNGELVNSLEVPPVSEAIAAGTKGASWSNAGYVALYDLSTFTAPWQTIFNGQYPIRNDSNAFWDNPSRVTLSQNAVYIFDAQHSLVKFALADGKIAWTVPISGAEPMSKPAAAAGVVYGFFSDGTVRAYSEADGSQLGIVMKVPLWYSTRGDEKPFRNLVGGVGVANDVLIVTTGCRSVYAIQRNL